MGRRGGVGEGRNLPVHNLAFEGLLTSPNCGVELRINTTSIQLQAYYNKAINYTLLVTCISLLQVPSLPCRTASPPDRRRLPGVSPSHLTSQGPPTP